MSTRKSTTDSVAPDLRAERETFVRNFLHKGVELTEDLIRENSALEMQLQKYQEENARLRAQLASNDAIRDLLHTIETLQQERSGLLQHSDELEKQEKVHRERYSQVEQELNDLASLYVASFQLNATLSPRRVVRHICELLEQLVGAQQFVVYVVSSDGKRALPIGARGKDLSRIPAVSAEEGAIGDVCLTGVARVFAPEEQREPGDPIALLPLTFESDVVGVIAIEALLPHKRGWARVDDELFKLLSAHGATALIAANLYEKAAAGPRAALSDLNDAMDDRHSLRHNPAVDAKAGADR